MTFAMDLEATVVRNPVVSNRAPFRHPPPHDPPPSSGVLVDVVVLSADAVLFEAIRNAVGERNPVWRARSAEESVDLLLTGRCGVLVVDMATVQADSTALIHQIVAQFPDVVVVVAGRREDEPLLATLISDGLVYRFMHKPLSAKRAGMFLGASIRHHVERRGLVAASQLLSGARRPSRIDASKWLFVAGGLAIFVALVAAVVGHPDGNEAPRPVVASPRPAVPAQPAAARLADPVLSRARAALASGRYESPVGRNALDLYAAVLLASPGHREATAGLNETIGRIVGLADQAAANGRTDEARRLLDRLQAVAPESDAVAALALRLDPPPEPIEPPAKPVAIPAPVAVAMPAAASTPIAARTPAATFVPPVIVAPPPRPPVPVAAPKRATVIPDPLTPRVVNSDDLRPMRASWRLGRASDPGLPAAPSLPIAGYAKPTAAVPAPPLPAEPATQTASSAVAAGAVPMPIDEFQPLTASEPAYPPQARRNGIEGWVELEFTITESGAVRDVEVVGAEPRGVFDQAAAEALARWRFVPRTAHGRPVPQRSVVTLRFNLDG